MVVNGSPAYEYDGIFLCAALGNGAVCAVGTGDGCGKQHYQSGSYFHDLHNSSFCAGLL